MLRLFALLVAFVVVAVVVVVVCVVGILGVCVYLAFVWVSSLLLGHALPCRCQGGQKGRRDGQEERKRTSEGQEEQNREGRFSAGREELRRGACARGRGEGEEEEGKEDSVREQEKG